MDLVRPSVEERVSQRQFQQSTRRASREYVFAEGDLVRVRNFRPGPKWLSATVLARTGPVSYRLSVVTPRGVCEWVRHRNHIVRAPDTDSTALTVLPDFDGSPELPAQGPSTPASTASARFTEQMPAQTNGSGTATRSRYPQRHRQPPERYVP